MTATVTYLRSEPETPPTQPDQLKAAMRNMAGGVSVVTAGTGEHRNGATVTSATALSMEPASMIVNINRSSSIWPIIGRYNHFCVNILSSGQQDIANRFAGKGGLKGVERYGDAEWFTLESGAAALQGALAAIDCAVEDVIERHSHAIIIGRVLAIVPGQGQPLLYHSGQYGNIIPA
jgi:flavin reductase (DIM6/NTAB) family NADH-FMN oxidoreductase RutF